MNYETYVFSRREKLSLCIQWLIISGIIGYFFYKSWIAFGLLSLLMPVFMKWREKEYIKRRKWELTLAFREAVGMVSGNLQAGNSVENAFRRTYGDLAQLYGKEADISLELLAIGRGLDRNMLLENLLMDFGNRSGVEDIKEFADIFAVAKRSGGNLREIIADTAEAISAKTEIKRELRTLISEKQFEQKIMCVIPFFILMYIGMTSPGYFNMLYHNISGISIMSACLVAYVGALLWGMKITEIEI